MFLFVEYVVAGTLVANFGRGILEEIHQSIWIHVWQVMDVLWDSLRNT